MKNRIKLYDRMRYRFENTLAHGTMALIGWLAIISLVIVIVAGVLISFAGISEPPDYEKLNLLEALWQSLTRTLDPGTFGQDQGWTFRLIMLFVTISGIMIISILIGILSTSFKSKVEELQRGHSKVLEKNHTLIIRWSPKIFTIISELIIANENQVNQSIVVLGNRNRMEMEREIRAKISDFKTTKVICRTGKPLELTDIERVNPNEAKSIIIISPDVENPDTQVIKSVMALTNNPNRKEGKYHIVAEIKDEANIEAAEVAGRGEVSYVMTADVVAKVTAQTSRLSGLSVVYEELLDYKGDEIYFQEELLLIGKTFKEAIFSYETSSVIGLQFADKTVTINPPMDTVIKKGDKIIAISEDDDTVILSKSVEFEIFEDKIIHEKTIPPPTESTLFLGWNDKAPKIIKELDNYAAPGSRVLIVAMYDDLNDEVERLNLVLNNQRVYYLKGNITFRSTLETIEVPTFDHIIILSYTKGIDLQEADAQTLICLLHLRNMSKKYGERFNVVSEMLDVRNQAIAEVARADDFIVSDKLISLMLAQLSENKYLKDVFDVLFDAEGSEIYLKPVTDYVLPNVPLNFYTVAESAARFGEVAFGYRVEEHAYDQSNYYGVIINPKKSDLIKFKKEDKIIVLAEN